MVRETGNKPGRPGHHIFFNCTHLSTTPDPDPNLLVPGSHVAAARRIKAVSSKAVQSSLRAGSFSRQRLRNSLNSDDHGPPGGRFGASASLFAQRAGGDDAAGGDGGGRKQNLIKCIDDEKGCAQRSMSARAPVTPREERVDLLWRHRRSTYI